MRPTFYFIARKYFVSYDYLRRKKFLAALFFFFTLAVSVQAGTPDCDHYGSAAPKNVLYAVNGKMVEKLEGNLSPGDEVTISFTTEASSDSTVFSLVSYKASGALPQMGLSTVYDMSSKFCGPGTHVLTIRVPETYFSLAFVRGCVNFEIGPSRCKQYYVEQDRLIGEHTYDEVDEYVQGSK
jgi:hypothetical protein